MSSSPPPRTNYNALTLSISRRRSSAARLSDGVSDGFLLDKYAPLEEPGLGLSRADTDGLCLELGARSLPRWL